MTAPSAIAPLPFAAVPAPAFAQMSFVSDSGDTAWMLAAAALVLLTALPGLVLLHAGRASAQNTLSPVTLCFAIAASVSLLWCSIGYSVAFAPGTALLGDASNFFLGNLADLREALTVPESTFALFQMMLAILAPALLSGIYAGRAQIGWAIGFSLVWSLIVYAPVAHWLWGGGWLANLGALDFAGGIVIHVNVGLSALVLAFIFGRRPEKPMPHSPMLAMAGAALLWIGWLGINGGWALTATDDAAIAMINAHLAACAASLTWALIERLRHGAASAMAFATGALAGLAAITTGAGYVSPSGAIAIGIAGAVIAAFAMRVAHKWLRLDDPLSLFAVHGIGGMTGALLVAGFAFPALGGPGLEGDGTMFTQFVAQAVAVIAVTLWSIIGTLVAAYGAAMLLPMRAPVGVDPVAPD